MKVLMMARNLVTDLSGPRYATEIARELIDSHNDVFIPTSNIKVELKNANILKLPSFFGKKPQSTLLYTLYGAAVRSKYNIQIVHGNGYTLNDDVTTVHFMSEAFDRQTKRFGMLKSSPKSYRSFVEKFILNSSKHLIAVSSLVKRDLIRLYNVPSERITTIHNGVTLNEFSVPTDQNKTIETQSVLREYGFDLNKKLLLFVGGGAYERKGFRFLVNALKYISDDVAVVAICRNLDVESQRLLTKLDIDKKVRIVNYVKDISRLYRAADIYILPTIYDPFPLAVLEAMACGLPVIVSSCTGITDIIDNGRNGIVVNDPSDSEELSNAINSLAQSYDQRKVMGLDARSTVEELSWKNVTRKVLDLYEQLSEK
ncbi:MAG: glycosyltransferase family 4 protein [Candidatus Bathyarchaeota archaeon]